MKKEELINNTDPEGSYTLQVISEANHFNKWMYQTISPFLKGDILEIGSGIGNISAFIVKEGLTITLSDYDPDYCSFLKHSYSKYPNVKDVLSIDLQHIEFTTRYVHLAEKFDTIIMLNVIEHLENDSAAAANCRFLLKKEGLLIVLAPAYQSLYCRFDKELGHYRRYSLEGLQSLLVQNQFRPVKSQYFNAFGIIGWFVFGKCLNKKMIGPDEMRWFNRLIPAFKLIDLILLKKAGLSTIVTVQKV